MYYVVKVSTLMPEVDESYPLSYMGRIKRWVYTNKRAAKLKYREVCKAKSHFGIYREYGMDHGGPIMRVHKHDKYTSEIVVTLRKIAYTPQKLHEVKLF